MMENKQGEFTWVIDTYIDKMEKFKIIGSSKINEYKQLAILVHKNKGVYLDCYGCEINAIECSHEEIDPKYIGKRLWNEYPNKWCCNKCSNK